MTDLADLSIPEASRLLRTGEISCRALTEAALARIEARNPRLAALTHLNTSAQEEADRAQSMIDAGDAQPLCGIPIGIKDLIDVEGLPATSGSALFRARVAAADAAAVARLRAAGAVILGKLATYEFAMVGPDNDLPDPPARNPWNPAHITGGSSSGSAAAVAGGMMRAALGTDTGGSARSPAAYCGCVGLKPSFGRVPVTGSFPLSPTLDHVGPIAATVEEAAIMLDAIGDEGWRPAAGRLGTGLSGLRIGFARDWHAADPETTPGVLRALDDAAAQLSMLGAQITLIPLPDYAVCEAAASVILHAEALDIHRSLIADHAGDYGRPVLQSLAFGAALDEADVRNARRAQSRLTEEMSQAMAGFDLVLTAAAMTPALPFSAFDGESAVWTPMRTIPFNLTGHPALVLPCGFQSSLPIGMQLVAARGAEDILCATGAAFERATDFSVQRPPL
ncbi:MAG: amidase [Proteobacteria bacterium]|nr:amidase [Pseudomonadota bacterium]